MFVKRKEGRPNSRYDGQAGHGGRHSLGGDPVGPIGTQLMGWKPQGAANYTQQSHCFPLRGANMTQGHQIIMVNGYDNQNQKNLSSCVCENVKMKGDDGLREME